MSEQAGFTINKEQQVTYTRKERSYLISKRDMDRLSKTIKEMAPFPHSWSNVAWGLLGIGVSCLISGFSGDRVLLFIVIGSFAMGGSVCAFFASKSAKNHHESSIDRLKDVFSDIESAIVDSNENMI